MQALGWRLAATARSRTALLPRAAAGSGQLRRSTSKRFKIHRVAYPWKAELERMSWDFLKQEMVSYFQVQGHRDSTVHVRATPWPKFTTKDQILEGGKLPAIISKYGKDRRIILNKEEMEKVAFDEPEGHLSYLFKGRLFRIHVDNWIEECVVADVLTHPVEQELYFVRFQRHVPGRVTTLPIPVTLAGLWGCKGYHKGGHVELAMPTVMCECVGETVPPPFLVDVSNLELEAPYGKITLGDIKDLLPADGLTRFWRKYSMDEEVVQCFDPKAIGEVPLPPDYLDPNFQSKKGRYNLTYTGYWPRQTTRQ